MKEYKFKQLPTLPNLKLAVVGHVEWVTFLAVDKLPKEGIISHSEEYSEEPAGGGAVAAVEMARLTGGEVHFFTSLGKDETGERSFTRLKQLGLKVSVGWQDKPTRKGISLVAPNGQRAITVIGERLQPSFNDELPWEELRTYDGVFITATDAEVIKYCRKAKVVVATPRVGLKSINDANIKLDALIGSGLDPDEQVKADAIKINPLIKIATEGAKGGNAIPGGRFKAIKLKEPIIDDYGCGDSFAAGVTVGLSSNWTAEEAISLGCHSGANCARKFGPYEKNIQNNN